MKKTVLIVDDQVGIRYLLEEILEQEGCNVELAANGKEALDKMEQVIPDLMMLDYKLPIMSSSELLIQLKQKEIQIPILVMSGLPDKAEEQMKLYACVKQIIAKPFQVNEIREIINDYLK